MDREQAKEYVKQGLELYLSERGINTRKPFRCLNSEHSDNRPSMSYDRNRQKAHCFSCGADYDIFDLIGIEYGITNDAEKFSKGYELFGLDVGKDSFKRRSVGGKSVPALNRRTQSIIHNTQHTNNTKIEDFRESSYRPDFTDVIEEAHKALLNNTRAMEYIESRGLSRETIEAYKIGYVEDGHNALLQDYPQYQAKSKKIDLYKYVFPYIDENGRSSYFITEIVDRTQVDEYNGKYRKLNKGDVTGKPLEAQLFNERYIKSKDCPKILFVCEGIYDALSIEEVGGKAIALMGIGQNRLLSMLKTYRPSSDLVLYLDNDTAGRTATESLKSGLDTLGIDYHVKMSSEGKDANEALQGGKDAFKEHIRKIIASVEKVRQRALQDKIEVYLSTSTSSTIKSFIDDIEKNTENDCIATGITSLDNILDGGLYTGLYCIGAISSLGKTSFCIQIADNIARSGKDVLIFSLEMDKKELIAKIISRLTFLRDLQTNQSTKYAKSTRDILSGRRYSNYCAEERQLILDTVKEYGEYANHVFIHEGVGDIGVEYIREKVAKHRSITGESPIVVVDYIQILAPYNERYTDKQNTDKSVIELKRLSRDYGTTVIGISSFNRENYTSPVNMASFKESGTIEFSADVLIGLQYEGMDWCDGESEKNRNCRIRDLIEYQTVRGKTGKSQSIQVKVLKNRNGCKGDTCIDFFPMYNFFSDKKQYSPQNNTFLDDFWQPVDDIQSPF